MGIFDALNTSVGGLQAQSFALQNISGNIANAQTTGFKGINTSFVDLVPEATNPDRQVAGGVTAYARQTVSTQGTVSASRCMRHRASPRPASVDCPPVWRSPSNPASTLPAGVACASRTRSSCGTVFPNSSP